MSKNGIMAPQFSKIFIAGLGLIGGSIARKLKQTAPNTKIIGLGKNNDTAISALELGFVDEYVSNFSELAAKCTQNDLIILAFPLAITADFFEKTQDFLNQNTPIITDVGSVKAEIIEIAKKYLSDQALRNFIPGHPIAGTEKTGVHAGFAELFIGKKTILCPENYTCQQAIEKVTKLWQSLGANIEIMPASQHDLIYAEISHLPQFLAFAYSSLLQEHHNQIIETKINKDAKFQRFYRIAKSSPEIWRDIFNMNRANLKFVLTKFITQLNANCVSDTQTVTNTAIENELIVNLPRLIVSSLQQIAQYPSYAGSGYTDFTSISQNFQPSLDLFKLKDEFLQKVEILSNPYGI